VSVEPLHLFPFVDEQAYRYNNSKPMNDASRFQYVRKIVGKHLTNAELTGKEEERKATVNLKRGPNCRRTGRE
jgi:hypothetical protein